MKVHIRAIVLVTGIWCAATAAADTDLNPLAAIAGGGLLAVFNLMLPEEKRT